MKDPDIKCNGAYDMPLFVRYLATARYANWQYNKKNDGWLEVEDPSSPCVPWPIAQITFDPAHPQEDRARVVLAVLDLCRERFKETLRDVS